MFGQEDSSLARAKSMRRTSYSFRRRWNCNLQSCHCAHRAGKYLCHPIGASFLEVDVSGQYYRASVVETRGMWSRAQARGAGERREHPPRALQPQPCQWPGGLVISWKTQTFKSDARLP
jgi:hypothetical protein